MEIKEQIKLRLKGVDFPGVHIKSLRSFKETEETPLKFNIKPQAFIPDDAPHTFKIIMNVDITAGDYFNLSLVGIGAFELSKEDVTEEERNSFINANAIAIVFPYVRAFIATLTSTLGANVTAPIQLPVQFFKGNIETIKSPDEIKALH